MYGEKFGRSYGGAVEEYRCDDADYVIVTMGSMTGVARATGWTRPGPTARR